MEKKERGIERMVEEDTVLRAELVEEKKKVRGHGAPRGAG